MTDLLAAYIITPLAGQVGDGTTGTLTFHHNERGKGWIPGLQTVGESAHRLGDDGTVAQTFGQAGKPMQVPLSAAFTTTALAITFCAAVEALTWTEVKIQDCWGRTIPRARINSVAVAQPVAAQGPTVGGTPTTVRVDCMLEIEILPAS